MASRRSDRLYQLLRRHLGRASIPVSAGFFESDGGAFFTGRCIDAVWSESGSDVVPVFTGGLITWIMSGGEASGGFALSF